MLGILGMALEMSACCTSVFGIMAGMVMGAMGLWMARAVLATAPGGADMAYAKVGQWAGGLSLAWGLFVGMLIGAYLLVYVVVIVFAILAG